MELNQTNLSRRGLFAGAAASAVIAAAAPALARAEQGEEGEWDGIYDVIVCGAGMAGDSAAVSVLMQDEAATVLMIEKGEHPNGNSSYAAGYTLYAEDEELVFQELKSYDGRAQTPDDVIRAFAKGLVGNKTWFEELGAKHEWLNYQEPNLSVQGAFDMGLPYDFPELADPEKGSAFGSVNFTGEGDSPATTMVFLQQKMEEISGDSGRLTYMASTPLEELIQDPQTKVITGVVAGGKRFKANLGVILCTGGFENNPDMLWNFTGVRAAYSSVPTLNTGDGIRAAQKVGADLWHIRNGQMFWCSPRNIENDRFLINDWNGTCKHLGITVGTNGRRFLMDFDGQNTYLDKGKYGGDLKMEVGWRHAMYNLGGSWMVALPIPELSWFIFDQAAMDNGVLAASYSDDPVADGWAYCAETIEELAQMIDVPADELALTVEQYNGFCAQGFDPAFYRPAETLNPVAVAPFYAMMCVPQFDNTNGGPRRGAGAEVLDVDGNPIPHLYECGEIGSVWGEFFQGAGDYADCAAFGRIAATNVLGNR